MQNKAGWIFALILFTGCNQDPFNPAYKVAAPTKFEVSTDMPDHIRVYWEIENNSELYSEIYRLPGLTIPGEERIATTNSREYNDFDALLPDSTYTYRVVPYNYNKVIGTSSPGMPGSIKVKDVDLAALQVTIITEPEPEPESGSSKPYTSKWFHCLVGPFRFFTLRWVDTAMGTSNPAYNDITISIYSNILQLPIFSGDVYDPAAPITLSVTGDFYLKVLVKNPYIDKFGYNVSFEQLTSTPTPGPTPTPTV